MTGVLDTRQEPPKLAGQVIVKSDERLLVVGRTGSGKTTLIKHMLPAYPKFVVIDPKQQFTMPGVPVLRDFEPRLPRQILRTKYERKRRMMDEHERYGDMIYRAFRAGNRIIYVDEVSGISKTYPPLPELAVAIKQGRERGVGVWTGSQRPKLLPSDVTSESEHVFIFPLQLMGDRIRVASFTNPHVFRALSGLQTHHFVYYHIPTDTMRRFTPLRL